MSAVEAITSVLRTEVEPLGIQVMAVEPGAFRTNAYAGFAEEPLLDNIDDYAPLLSSVRATMIAEHGHQPGNPARGARDKNRIVARHGKPLKQV